MSERPRSVAATKITTGVVLATSGWWLAGAQVAEAGPAPASSCPAGSNLVPGSAGVCEVVFTQPGTSSWQVPVGVTNIDVLAVGGGGAGGYTANGGGLNGSGGGGGGAVTVCTTEIVDATNSITVDVGSGGDGFNPPNFVPTSGAPTSVAGPSFTCSANGGQVGQGGYDYSTPPSSGSYGGGGASGSNQPGGAGATYVTMEYDPVLYEYGTFTASGGGGAAGPGQTWSTTAAGAGGSGVIPTAGLFAGNTAAYGGGGGGGIFSPYLTDINSNAPAVGGAGGLGGGGAGAKFNSAGNDGVANSGGGGGGSVDGYLSGNGGSGIVIIRFSLAPLAPTDLVVTGAVRSLNASWHGSAGALSYVCTLLYGFRDPSSFSITVPTPTCTFGGLAPNTPYGISVVARTSSGVSPAVSAFAKTKPLPRRRHR